MRLRFVQGARQGNWHSEGSAAWKPLRALARAAGMTDDLIEALERLAIAAERIQEQLLRIADHFDPPPPDIVDSPYIADRLGVTTTRIAQMIREGTIPKDCIVPGTGNGRLWKCYRSRIRKWLETR